MCMQVPPVCQSVDYLVTEPFTHFIKQPDSHQDIKLTLQLIDRRPSCAAAIR